MKQGSTLMALFAAMALMTPQRKLSNSSSKANPKISHGGKPSKLLGYTRNGKFFKSKKVKNRIAKKSRNINHKKAA